MQQYTNEITPEIRESYIQPPYDNELLSDCDDEIISPPQSISKLAFCEGDTLSEEFLTMPGVSTNGSQRLFFVQR
jgi:hypothetical protein